jgi:hypothetical protein
MLEKADFPDLLVITREQTEQRLDVIDKYFDSSFSRGNVVIAVFHTNQLSGGSKFIRRKYAACGR